MNCPKLFGTRIISRDPDRQTADQNPAPHHSPLSLGPMVRHGSSMNRCSALGRVEIEAIA